MFLETRNMQFWQTCLNFFGLHSKEIRFFEKKGFVEKSVNVSILLQIEHKRFQFLKKSFPF